jgi:hypothetical protein
VNTGGVPPTQYGLSVYQWVTSRGSHRVGRHCGRVPSRQLLVINIAMVVVITPYRAGWGLKGSASLGR